MQLGPDTLCSDYLILFKIQKFHHIFGIEKTQIF